MLSKCCQTTRPARCNRWYCNVFGVECLGVRIPLAPQTTRIAHRDAGFSYSLALQTLLHEASVSFPLTRVGAGVDAAPNDSRSRGARYLRVRVRLCGRTVGFPDSCLFSQIRRGSLWEFGAVAIDLPTGMLEFRHCEKSSPKPFSGERRRNRPFPVNSHETMGLSPPMAGVWVTSHTLPWKFTDVAGARARFRARTLRHAVLAILLERGYYVQVAAREI